MYQPVKGDRVRVLGPETPKFIVSNGLFREYLELTVTFNTEQVPKGDPVGKNLPHKPPHWSYEATNWFEGITEWEVELPDPQKTYVAEFQGCCRVNKMAILQKNGCIETRYGRGVLQNCETPYFLRSTVNLNFVPPPISFIPSMVPYTFLNDQKLLDGPLQLPILDYRTTSKGMQRIPPQDVLWPQKIANSGKQVGMCVWCPFDFSIGNRILFWYSWHRNCCFETLTHLLRCIFVVLWLVLCVFVFQLRLRQSVLSCLGVSFVWFLFWGGGRRAETCTSQHQSWLRTQKPQNQRQRATGNQRQQLVEIPKSQFATQFST